MTRPANVSSKPDTPVLEVCASCGEAVGTPVDGRCPVCGERLVDEDVTSEDHTPYATALASGGGGWRSMCRWVMTASDQRLAHLGLARPSAASRRFARINIVLFAGIVSLAVLANYPRAWHAVQTGPGSVATEAPAGKGWWQVVDRSGVPRTRFDDVAVVELWWNVPYAFIVAAGALLAALVVSFVVLAVVAARGQRALGGEARGAPNVRCAVHYSTAWVHLLSVAALLLIPAPLARLGAVAGWAQASPVVFHGAAVLLGVSGVCLWWFWLVRLGQATPRGVRRRAVRYFLAGAPFWVLVLSGGAFYGAYVGAQRVGALLGFIK